MGRLRDYSIQFAGLSEGIHEFGFVIGSSFFDNFDQTEIHKADLKANVILIKKANFIDLQITIHGLVEVVCDRCLDAFYLPVSTSNRLYVRFGTKTYEQTEEIIILAEGEHEIYLGQLFYEFVHLAVPYQKVHQLVEGAECDKQMMEQLKAILINDRKNIKADPRWDQLKTLIQNN